jgi:hypothetical protein
MAATMNAVTSQFKVEKYTQWVQYCLNPITQRVKFQGRLYQFIQRLEDQHQQIIGELRNGLEAADRVRKEQLENDPHLTRIISTPTGTSFGSMIGAGLGVVWIGLSAPLALFWATVAAGGIAGTFVGSEIADKHFERQSYIASLPFYKQIFDREVAWVRNVYPSLTREISSLNFRFRINNNPTLSGYLRYIVEKAQLAALKAHFDFIIQQDQAIANLPIYDPKSIAANLETIKEGLASPTFSFGTEETFSQKDRKEQQRRHDFNLKCAETNAINMGMHNRMQQNRFETQQFYNRYR